jgi:hypothetical protein
MPSRPFRLSIERIPGDENTSEDFSRREKLLPAELKRVFQVVRRRENIMSREICAEDLHHDRLVLGDFSRETPPERAGTRQSRKPQWGYLDSSGNR